MFKNLKLTTKITLFTVGILTIISLIYGISGYALFNNLLQQEISDDAGEVNLNFLANQTAETQVLSAVSNTLNSDQTVMQLFLKKDREGLYKHLAPTFESLKKEFGVTLLDFYLVDRTNLLRMQAKDRFGDKDAHDLFFDQVDSTKQLASGLGIEHGDIALREVRPYINQNKIVGYIEIGESISHLILELQKRTKDDFAVFMDKAMIPAENLSAIKKDPSLIETPEHIELSITGKNNLFKNCFYDGISKIVIAKGSAIISQQINGEGKRYTCSALNVTGIKGEHLGIILVLADVTTFFDAINNSSLMILGALAGFSLLFFFIINYFIRHSVTDPLLELNMVAGEIARGNLSKRIEIRLNDEIGQLSASFNNMVDKLKQSYENLEGKIKERTADLAKKTEQLEKKNEESEEREQAILNIMDDLDSEKKDLERINAKDEAFLGSIGEGLIVTDQEGKPVLASRVALVLTGLSLEQLRSKVWAKDYPIVEDEYGKQVPYEKTPVYSALHNKGTMTTKFFYKMADGKRFPALVTAAPVVIDGKNQGAVVVFRDITREEEIDKAKSEFISLASHQLRTPLSAIKWFVELLGDTKNLTEQQMEFMNNISKSTERMIELVNALLNISRIESGRITINPQPTNMAELLQDVIKSMSHIVDEKKLQLNINIDKDLPQVNVDQKMIQVVYENFLSNAIKYTPEGGQISVSVKKQNDEIISDVTDTGLGIAEKDQKRIFDKFFRGENVIKVVPDGTGLGLYLTKSIVESSQGKIGFESKEGKGSKFWFTLPISGMPAKKGEVSLS